MTFIAPTPRVRALGVPPRQSLQVRAAQATSRGGFVEEDSARRALGSDSVFPAAMLPGHSLEHLARIALG